MLTRIKTIAPNNKWSEIKHLFNQIWLVGKFKPKVGMKAPEYFAPQSVVGFRPGSIQPKGLWGQPMGDKSYNILNHFIRSKGSKFRIWAAYIHIFVLSEIILDLYTNSFFKIPSTRLMHSWTYFLHCSLIFYVYIQFWHHLSNLFCRGLLRGKGKTGSWCTVGCLELGQVEYVKIGNSKLE